MKLVKTTDPETQSDIYRLEITAKDFTTVRLDRFDYALFDECAKSNKVSDALLALETLARRIES